MKLTVVLPVRSINTNAVTRFAQVFNYAFPVAIGDEVWLLADKDFASPVVRRSYHPIAESLDIELGEVSAGPDRFEALRVGGWKEDVA